VLTALLTSLAVVLHWVESLLPVPYVMPGAKLGLANVVALYVVLNMGTTRGLLVSVLRTVIGSLMGGTFMSVTFILSFTGAIVSTIAMGLIRKAFGKEVSSTGVSVVGAVAHNLGQLGAAAFIVKQTGVFLYLPLLMVFAIPTGLLIGLCVSRLPAVPGVQS
jgi:heptaprenyl diphosphate synthase